MADDFNLTRDQKLIYTQPFQKVITSTSHLCTEIYIHIISKY